MIQVTDDEPRAVLKWKVFLKHTCPVKGVTLEKASVSHVYDTIKGGVPRRPFPLFSYMSDPTLM